MADTGAALLALLVTTALLDVTAGPDPSPSTKATIARASCQRSTSLKKATDNKSLTKGAVAK